MDRFPLVCEGTADLCPGQTQTMMIEPETELAHVEDQIDELIRQLGWAIQYRNLCRASRGRVFTVADWQEKVDGLPAVESRA